MITLLRLIEICIFKAGPEYIPVSHWLMRFAVLNYFIVVVVIKLLEYSWEISLFTSLALVIWMLLQFRGFMARYQQTLTAIAGTGVILGLIGLSVLMSFLQVGSENKSSGLTMLLMISVLF